MTDNEFRVLEIRERNKCLILGFKKKKKKHVRLGVDFMKYLYFGNIIYLNCINKIYKLSQSVGYKSYIFNLYRYEYYHTFINKHEVVFYIGYTWEFINIILFIF